MFLASSRLKNIISASYYISGHYQKFLPYIDNFMYGIGIDQTKVHKR